MRWLFLDCEWADTLASELVSLALVPDDPARPEFYARTSSVFRDTCSTLSASLAVIWPCGSSPIDVVNDLVQARQRVVVADQQQASVIPEELVREHRMVVPGESGHSATAMRDLQPTVGRAGRRFDPRPTTVIAANARPFSGRRHAHRPWIHAATRISPLPSPISGRSAPCRTLSSSASIWAAPSARNRAASSS